MMLIFIIIIFLVLMCYKINSMILFRCIFVVWILEKFGEFIFGLEIMEMR